MDSERRTGMLIGGTIAGMVLTLVFGLVLLFGGGGHEEPRQVTSSSEPTEEPVAPTTVATPKTKPEQQFRCFDGKVIKARETCSVETEAASFYAFGIDRSTCSPTPTKGGAHNRWSYDCRIRGVDVHLATYEAAARAGRLSEYGAQQDLGNGRVLAGGPTTRAGRWLRTYYLAGARKGLLMYASVDADDPYNRQVLMSLGQRFAGHLLQGEPVPAAG